MNDDESRYGRWAFGALLAFLLVNLVAPQQFVPALEVLRPALLCALVAAGAHLLDKSNSAQNEPMALEVRIVLWIAFWAVATIPLSIWPGGSFADSLLFLRQVLFFWLMTRIIRRPYQLRIVLWTLVGVAALFAVTAVSHFRSGVYLNRSDRIAGYGTGAVADPNDLAMFLVATLPIAVALAMISRGRARWLACAAVVTYIIGVVVTFSRGGALGLGVVIFWGLCIAARRGKGWLIAVFVVFAMGAAAMMPSKYTARLGAISVDGDSSSQFRWNNMVLAVEYIGQHPIFGAGFHRELDALAKVGGRWNHVHCAYLQIGVDLGLPGLILFIALIASGWFSALRVEQDSLRAGLTELAYLATGIRVGLTGYAVAAVFLPVAYGLPLYYLIAISVGLRACQLGAIGTTAPAAVNGSRTVAEGRT